MEIDLNALVEGWALDRIIGLLAKRGCQNVLVELGGEFRGTGSRADGQPWRVGIENPGDAAACYATVAIEDAALATSGDYRQARKHGGSSYSHIMDPRTGAPICHDITAVSVVADDALTADGWATALLVLGPEAGPALAERRGLVASFVRRTADAGVPQLSSRAAGKIELIVGPTSASDRPRGGWSRALVGQLGAGVGLAVAVMGAIWNFHRRRVRRRVEP